MSASTSPPYQDHQRPPQLGERHPQSHFSWRAVTSPLAAANISLPCETRCVLHTPLEIFPGLTYMSHPRLGAAGRRTRGRVGAQTGASRATARSCVFPAQAHAPGPCCVPQKPEARHRGERTFRGGLFDISGLLRPLCSLFWLPSSPGPVCCHTKGKMPQQETVLLQPGKPSRHLPPSLALPLDVIGKATLALSGSPGWGFGGLQVLLPQQDKQHLPSLCRSGFVRLQSPWRNHPRGFRVQWTLKCN